MSMYDSILITGGGGMLGRALTEQLTERGHHSTPLRKAQLDVSDAAALGKAFAAHKPTLVLNCAAHTKVDLCEEEREKAEAINGRAVGVMADLCHQHGACLVHVSTDFVFDGSSKRPYRIKDPVNPLQAYGRSKLLGEQLLQKSPLRRWLMIRTAWVYGRGGANFPRTMVTAAQAGKPLSVINDQIGAPTYAVDLAEAILALLGASFRGVCHVTNSGKTNWHEFAVATLAEFGINAPVAPLSSEQWKKIRPASAARPAYSVLNMGSFISTVGWPTRPWREGLKDFAAAVKRDGF
jgi:dTDP-4-dehydrorhamnose reductase